MSVTWQMPQTLEQIWHRQIRQIRNVELRS